MTETSITALSLKFGRLSGVHLTLRFSGINSKWTSGARLDLLWVVAFVLAVSFLSNVSPFFGASYTLLTTLQLTLLGFTVFNFLLLVVVSAVGATLAKVAIYYGAFELKGILRRNKNIRLIGKNSSTRKFYIALFATALLPVLPLDDFIYIGAGASAVSISLMALVTLTAKLLKSGVEVWLEFTILGDVSKILGINTVYTTVALSVAFIVIGIAIYKLDWEELYARVRGRGVPSTSAA